MNLLYAIYDPFQCGNNLVILINEKPDNISISRETNEWAYHAYGNLFERNTIGTGAHVPKDEFWGTAMVIQENNRHHLENLLKLLDELNLELFNPPN